MHPPDPILCFSSIDWDFLWQGHQEIMATFAQRGHRVLFIENTGVRNPRIADMGRIRRRLANWRRSLKGFREERKDLYLYSPLILPFPYSRLARWVNRWLLLSALKRWMQALEFYHPICWTFLPTPLTLECIRRIPHRLLVYYCIDSFADSTPAAQRIVPSEQQLFREADLVFVTSHHLKEQALRHNRQVHLFPFGVSLQNFQRASHPDGPPPEMARCRRPIIGYVGGIHRWVDQDLLCALARAHRDYSFLLVGPIQTDVERLRKIPNITLTGQRPHEELPRYVRHFDVGVIPYLLTDYTRNVYPTKLNEYHILGKPVVSTPLPEILEFNRRYGPLVGVASAAEEFSAALESALSDSSADLVRRRQEAARDNSWERRIDAMQQLIEQTIETKEAEPRESWSQRFQASWARPRLLLRWAAILGVALLALFETPIVWFAAEPLRVQEELRPADAIVVFAGGVGESGQPGQGYQERVKQGVELYQQGLASRLVFVSGYTWAFQEAEIMRALAESLGVPASRIGTVTNVRSTRDYVLEVKRLAEQSGWDSILLVTPLYHGRRAHLAFARSAPSLTVLHAPVSESSFYAHRRGIRPRQLRALLHEAAALLAYRLRGWI